MGWSSGTEVFDKVAEELLEDDPNLHSDKSVRILIKLEDVLSDKDWDTQCESAYWEHPIIRYILGNTEEEDE